MGEEERSEQLMVCSDHTVRKEESRMIEVTDNWWPCFPGNKIELRIYLYWENESENVPSKGAVRMIATGADDTYVEMEYEEEGVYSLHSLEFRYSHWKKYIFDKVPDGVNKQWFYEHGFNPSGY